MRIKKICGPLAVAISIFAWSATAVADHASTLPPYFSCPVPNDRVDVAGAIAAMAETLRCEGFTDGEDGKWGVVARDSDGNPSEWDPIWQKGPPKDVQSGCEVHFSLSKLLDAPAEEKKGKGKGIPQNGDRRGAARAVSDFQDWYATELLQEFIDTIVNGVAKLRPDDDPMHSHYLQAAYFAQAARDAQKCIDGIEIQPIQVSLFGTNALVAESAAIEGTSGSGGGSFDLPLLMLLALSLLGRARRFDGRL